MRNFPLYITAEYTKNCNQLLATGMSTYSCVVSRMTRIARLRARFLVRIIIACNPRTRHRSSFPSEVTYNIVEQNHLLVQICEHSHKTWLANVCKTVNEMCCYIDEIYAASLGGKGDLFSL